jgi:hypothetical protein
MPTIDIPDKICPHCGGTKYYHRVYKRISKITGRNYEFHECRNCNNKGSRNWAINNESKVKKNKEKCYLKYKEDPLKKKKRAQNAKNYRQTIKDSPEHKEKIKKYCKKAFQILKNSLSDRYIKDRLVIEAGKKVIERHEIPQELIELKRKQLLLKRKIKNNG